MVFVKLISDKLTVVSEGTPDSYRFDTEYREDTYTKFLAEFRSAIFPGATNFKVNVNFCIHTLRANTEERAGSRANWLIDYFKRAIGTITAEGECTGVIPDGRLSSFKTIINEVGIEDAGLNSLIQKRTNYLQSKIDEDVKRMLEAPARVAAKKFEEKLQGQPAPILTNVDFSVIGADVTTHIGKTNTVYNIVEANTRVANIAFFKAFVALIVANPSKNKVNEFLEKLCSPAAENFEGNAVAAERVFSGLPPTEAGKKYDLDAVKSYWNGKEMTNLYRNKSVIDLVSSFVTSPELGTPGFAVLLKPAEIAAHEKFFKSLNEKVEALHTAAVKTLKSMKAVHDEWAKQSEPARSRFKGLATAQSFAALGSPIAFNAENAKLIISHFFINYSSYKPFFSALAELIISMNSKEGANLASAIMSKVIVPKPGASKQIELYPWQLHFIESFLAGESSIVEAPTSAGKTYAIRSALATALAQDLDIGLVCFVLPTDELAIQIRSSHEKTHKNIPSSLLTETCCVVNEKTRVFFGTPCKLLSYFRQFPSVSFDIMIFDEIHTVDANYSNETGSYRRASAIQELFGYTSKQIIGLSATIGETERGVIAEMICENSGKYTPTPEQKIREIRLDIGTTQAYTIKRNFYVSKAGLVEYVPDPVAPNFSASPVDMTVPVDALSTYSLFNCEIASLNKKLDSSGNRVPLTPEEYEGTNKSMYPMIIFDEKPDFGFANFIDVINFLNAKSEHTYWNFRMINQAFIGSVSRYEDKLRTFRSAINEELSRAAAKHHGVKVDEPSKRSAGAASKESVVNSGKQLIDTIVRMLQVAIISCTLRPPGTMEREKYTLTAEDLQLLRSFPSLEDGEKLRQDEKNFLIYFNRFKHIRDFDIIIEKTEAHSKKVANSGATPEERIFAERMKKTGVYSGKWLHYLKKPEREIEMYVTHCEDEVGKFERLIRQDEYEGKEITPVRRQYLELLKAELEKQKKLVSPEEKRLRAEEALRYNEEKFADILNRPYAPLPVVSVEFLSLLREYKNFESKQKQYGKADAARDLPEIGMPCKEEISCYRIGKGAIGSIGAELIKMTEQIEMGNSENFSEELQNFCRAERINVTDVSKILSYIRDGIKYGIGIIYPTMPYIIKYYMFRMIDNLDASGVSVFFSSYNMSMGINLPNKTAVKRSQTMKWMSPSVALQMDGRSGRQGFDYEGFCISWNIDNTKSICPQTLSKIVKPIPGPSAGAYFSKEAALSAAISMETKVYAHIAKDKKFSEMIRNFGMTMKVKNVINDKRVREKHGEEKESEKDKFDEDDTVGGAEAAAKEAEEKVSLKSDDINMAVLVSSTIAEVWPKIGTLDDMYGLQTSINRIIQQKQKNDPRAYHWAECLSHFGNAVQELQMQFRDRNCESWLVTIKSIFEMLHRLQLRQMWT